MGDRKKVGTTTHGPLPVLHFRLPYFRVFRSIIRRTSLKRSDSGCPRLRYSGIDLIILIRTLLFVNSDFRRLKVLFETTKSSRSSVVTKRSIHLLFHTNFARELPIRWSDPKMFLTYSIIYILGIVLRTVFPLRDVSIIYSRIRSRVVIKNKNKTLNSEFNYVW